MRLFPYKILIIVVAAAVVIYHVWLSFSFFGLGDWNVYYAESLRESVDASTWIGVQGFGWPSVIIWKIPYLIIFGAFGFLSFDSSVADKLTILWPLILLMPISSFFVVWHLSRSALASFVGSAIFAYSSYFLAINTHGHEHLVLASGWGVLALYFVMRAIGDRSMSLSAIGAIVLAIAGYYDFRFAYIFFGVSALYFLVSWWREAGSRWVVVRLGSVFAAVFVLLNVFWLLPFAATGTIAENSGVGRDLTLGQYFDLDSALYLAHPFWTGYGVVWFSDQPTPWWLSVTAILAIVGFWVGRRNRDVLFFAVIALLGILLGKQTAEPFPSLYPYLYDHLPGFNAFREASKFYVLTAIGYAVGIGALVERILGPVGARPPSPCPKTDSLSSDIERSNG